MRVTKETAAGRAYLELQNQARREKRPTQELFTLYVLERWLARLAISPWAGSFVLKGGVLLAVFEARRPTADADLLALSLSNDVPAVLARVTEVASVVPEADDGVAFLTDTVAAQVIRDDDLYAGVRVTMDCLLAAARVKLRLDVNVGDPVTPSPQELSLPSQRPGVPPVPVLGYPVETVLAEKTCTALALGAANSRVRDYADLYTLTGRPLDFALVSRALTATAAHRGVPLRPLSAVVGDLASARAAAYSAFRRRLGADGSHLPSSFDEVVSAVVRYADPLVSGGVSSWDPVTRSWS